MTTHKDEIVERLRDYGVREKPLRDEAADFIEQQASTIERMEEVLREVRPCIESYADGDCPSSDIPYFEELLAKIDAALTNKERMDG